MTRTRKLKVPQVVEDALDHFAGPARLMSEAGVDAVTRRFKKALVERMLGGELAPRSSRRAASFPPMRLLALRNITATWGKEALLARRPQPVRSRVW